MMTDITLYYAPDNASAVVRMVLEAGEIPYNAIFIDRAKNEQKGAEYRALNPTGFIPLVIIDSKKLFETSAILRRRINDGESGESRQANQDTGESGHRANQDTGRIRTQGESGQANQQANQSESARANQDRHH